MAEKGGRRDQRHQDRHKRAHVEGTPASQGPECAIIFWKFRGLKGAPNRGPLRSQAGAEAGHRGHVTVLSFPSGDFLARSTDIVIDEGQYFGICTRLVLLTELMSVDHHQNPSISIQNKAGCLLPLLPSSVGTEAKGFSSLGLDGLA